MLRFAERKYVDSRASSGPTNGGPHERVSSPVGDSILITRAPRSPSIIPACGPASARVRSRTSRSDRGPSAMAMPARVPTARADARLGLVSQMTTRDVTRSGPLSLGTSNVPSDPGGPIALRSPMNQPMLRRAVAVVAVAGERAARRRRRDRSARAGRPAVGARRDRQDPPRHDDVHRRVPSAPRTSSSPTPRGNVYVGYAAHCAGLGAATDTNGCLAESLPLGTPVTFNEGGSLVSEGTVVGQGTLVYSSWLTMHEPRHHRRQHLRLQRPRAGQGRRRRRRQGQPVDPVLGRPDRHRHQRHRRRRPGLHLRQLQPPLRHQPALAAHRHQPR